MQPRVLEAALVAEAEEREGRGPRRVELAPLLHLSLDIGARISDSDQLKFQISEI